MPEAAGYKGLARLEVIRKLNARVSGSTTISTDLLLERTCMSWLTSV